MLILGSYWTLDTEASSFIQLTTGVGEPETESGFESFSRPGVDKVKPKVCPTKIFLPEK